MVLGVDGEMRVQRWSTAAEETFGVAPETAIGAPLTTSFATPQDRTRLQEGFERAARDGAWEGHLVARHANGEAFPAAVVIDRIDTAGGRRAGGTVVITDVSEDERAATERSALAEQLAERVKEFGLLAEAARLLADPSGDLHEVLTALAQRVPKAFRRADAASARIVFEQGLVRHEASSHTGAWRQRTSRVIERTGGGKLFIEVGYRDHAADDDEDFLPEEQQLLDAVASLLDGYLERRAATECSRLLQHELERRTHVQRVLLDVYTRYLSGATEDVAAMVLDAALAAVPRARLGSVLVRTERGGYRFAALRGYDPAALAGVEIPNDVVLFGHDWSAGRAFVVSDVAAVNERLQNQRPDLEPLTLATGGTAAVESLIAPVLVDGELVAAISIEHSETSHAFDAGDGELLQLFAQSIGALMQRTEAEARADLMARAVNAASDGIAVIDLPANGLPARVLHANPAFAALLGFDRASSEPRWDPATVLDRVTAKQVLASAQSVIATGEPARFELRAQLPGGRQPWLEASTSRLDTDALGARLLVTVRDVTARYEHLAELEQLTDDLQARLSEMQALEAIDTAITRRDVGSGDPLARVAEEVARRPGVSAASVLVADDASSALRFAAGTGALRALRAGRRVDDSDPAQRARRERRPIRRDDLVAAVASTAPNGWDPGTAGAYQAWPLVIQDHVVGVMETLLATGFVPQPAWSRFMATLGAQVAIAVEHTAMIERLQRSSSAYARLAEFSGRIEEVVDPDELVDLGVQTLMHEFAMQGAAYFVGDGARLVLSRTWGENPGPVMEVLREPQEYGSGAVGAAAATGEAVFVENYASWPNADSDIARASIGSVLAAPVRSEGGTSGVIAIGAFERTVSLRPDQLAIARAFMRRLEHALERVAYQQQIERTREEAFRSLGVALEYRDYETKGHTDRVVALARRLGRRVGLDDEALEALAWGAYLHDLGKITISDQILLKPARLTPAEFEQVKRHTVTGFEMSLELAFLPDATREVIRSHHERWDGGGYPDGLAGEAIPFLARAFALVDVYDALTSERPYKQAWSHGEAVAELAAQAGRQFDPDLSAAMLALLVEESGGAKAASTDPAS